MTISGSDVKLQPFWDFDRPSSFIGDYEDAKSQTISLLAESVKKRMIADVPLGSFLSGGTDSSAVVAMASQFDSNLHTFSIGYRDHDFFDETNFAELVAKKFKTQHTTFSLTNDDLLDCVYSVIEYIDEPFADSSAIPTYILSKHVSQHIKVALTGDGADELFGGYYKHLAFLRSGERTLPNYMIKGLNPLLHVLPHSRSSKAGNLARRVSKYAQLMEMNPFDKYWFLASFNVKAQDLLLNNLDQEEINGLSGQYNPKQTFDLNAFLDVDLKMVLPGDMLTKVDLMSMANSLEVRVPFLDKELVRFARSLPPHFKVKKNKRKTVLQDAFEHILPKELHHRSKKGFEVPMLDWMRNELRSSIEKVVFDIDHINEQGIFNANEVLRLRSQLDSRNPGDVHSVLWTLYVFQKWYNRHFE